ncbi:MAG TPA: EFR1 family ferrodoxin, partial [Candidatus Methanofastidiosa archaeon]|nr:EFR1 family ferrodoxin [Candidatus Methanofastidiosa archaeon]
MDKEVYYFSGTGNSLVAARTVSMAIGARMLAMPPLMRRDVIESSATTIGIVFPVYNKGMPSIVERFIEKMCDLEGKYVFGICTYGHAPCLTIRYLSKAIGAIGGRLAAGFAVRMPYNYLVPSLSIRDFFGSFMLEQIPMATKRDLISASYRKLDQIGEYVLSKREGIHETSNETIGSLSDVLGLKGSLQRWTWLKVAGSKDITD